jgi:hypothetical protein
MPDKLCLMIPAKANFIDIVITIRTRKSYNTNTQDITPQKLFHSDRSQY